MISGRSDNVFDNFGIDFRYFYLLLFKISISISSSLLFSILKEMKDN